MGSYWEDHIGKRRIQVQKAKCDPNDGKPLYIVKGIQMMENNARNYAETNEEFEYLITFDLMESKKVYIDEQLVSKSGKVESNYDIEIEEYMGDMLHKSSSFIVNMCLVIMAEYSRGGELWLNHVNSWCATRYLSIEG